MTAHLLIMYPHPKDVKEFDRAYREEHLPYAAPRLKGATGVATKRVVGPSFAPPPYHLISDVSFPTNRDAKGNCCLKRQGSVDPRGIDQFRRRADGCGCH
jgi:hypothetical protein